MSVTFRHFWPDPMQGRLWFNFNLPGVVVKKAGVVSAVQISACEYAFSGGVFGGDVNLIRGDAIIWVGNIHPYIRVNSEDPVEQDGGVEFVLQIDAAAPILVATTITVFTEDVAQS